MSQLQGGISRKSSTTELEIIKQKRLALQKLVKLTSMLNQLHQGLNSIILMGKSAAQIPEKIVHKFKTLTDSLKKKPTEILKNTLTSTDVKIDRNIKHVLEISQKSNELLEQELGATGTKLADALKDDYNDFVSDFKKKSQTSITLRITLKTRKELVKAFNLPVPESFIKHQIISLNVKEEKCRELIKKDMASLQSDVNALLNKEDCPEEFKSLLSEIKTELKDNSEHFESGKPIDEMPIMYESIELAGIPQVVEEVEEIINPRQADVVEEEQDINAQKKKLGFFKHFITWLKAPWDKSWKDTG